MYCGEVKIAGLGSRQPARSKRIQMIRPPFRHTHTLIPILTPCIGAPDGIAVLVGQGAFDGV